MGSALSLLVAACGDASTGDAATPLPEFQGPLPAEPAASVDDGSASAEENGATMAPAPPSGAPTGPNGEGAGGDIALQPSGDSAEGPGVGEETGSEPEDTVDVAEPEVPVPSGPPPKFFGNFNTGN